MRIPCPWHHPLAAGRLLLLSTFPDSLRRPTTATAARRNACATNLAHRILILHAAQGGKTEALCQHRPSPPPSPSTPSPPPTTLTSSPSAPSPPP